MPLIVCRTIDSLQGLELQKRLARTTLDIYLIITNTLIEKLFHVSTDYQSLYMVAGVYKRVKPAMMFCDFCLWHSLNNCVCRCGFLASKDFELCGFQIFDILPFCHISNTIDIDTINAISVFCCIFINIP